MRALKWWEIKVLSFSCFQNSCLINVTEMACIVTIHPRFTSVLVWLYLHKTEEMHLNAESTIWAKSENPIKKITKWLLECTEHHTLTINNSMNIKQTKNFTKFFFLPLKPYSSNQYLIQGRLDFSTSVPEDVYYQKTFGLPFVVEDDVKYKKSPRCGILDTFSS